MAAANSTPIQLYYSNTPGSTPTSANLIIGELAINVPDGIIFYKDATNTVNVIARTAAAAGKFPVINFLGDDTRQYTASAPFATTNAIWNQANTSTQNITIIQGVNLTQNSIIDTTGIYANSGYTTANSAQLYANGAFIKANAAFGTANSAAQYTNAAFALANTNASSIETIQGVGTTQNTNIDSASSYANSAFVQANNTNSYAISGFGTANTAFGKANSAGSYANSAFTLANTNASSITTIQGVDAKQNSDITYASTLAQQAYNFANTLSGGTASDGIARLLAQNAYDQANSAYTLGSNAVANTSVITLAGSLNVPGYANVNQRLAVGTGSYTILPNLIAQFTGSSDYYSQINQQNLSGKGSGDIVVTSDNGTDATNYVDMGIAGSTYENTTPNAFPMVDPNDAYLMMVGDAGASIGGNLHIGTSGSGAFADITIIQGSAFDETARFVDGQGLVLKSGTAAANTTSGALVVQGGAGVSGSLYAGEVYDGTTRLKTYTETANTFLQSTKVSKTGDTITGQLTINNGTATALAVTGNVTISKDLTISGNLIIGGNTTSVSANNLVVDDSLLYIANNNSGNTSDIGLVAHFISDKYQHTGFVRDASDGVWKLFSNVSPEPTTTVDFTTAIYDTLKVGTLESGNVIAGSLNVEPYLQSSYNTANAAFEKANTGGVVSVSVASSNRLTANSSTGNVRLDLATTSVVAGTYSYPYLNVDAYGRITSILNQDPVTSFNTRTGSVSLQGGDVTDALGYTPVDNTTYLADLGLQQGLDNRQNTSITIAGSYANSAYARANSTLVRANVAFDKANLAYDSVQSGQIYANGAFEAANVAQSTADSKDGLIISAGDYANNAFSKANSAFTNVTAASIYANGAFIKANTAFNNAGGASNYANGAFVQANTATADAGGASNYANGAFAQANTATNNAAGASQYANGAFIMSNSAFAQANTATNNAAGASQYANGAFALANTVSTYANTPHSTLVNGSYTVTLSSQGVLNLPISQYNTSQLFAPINYDLLVGTSSQYWQFKGDGSAIVFPDNTRQSTAYPVASYSTANSAAQYANTAFEKANNALANTSGATFGGDLHVAGNLDVVTIAFPDGTSQNTSTNAIASYANSAYARANSSGSYANAAFIHANNAFDAANNAYTAGGVIAGGYANSAFGVANTSYNGMIAAGSYANSAFGLVNSAFEAANTAYTAGGVIAGSYANSAFGVANTALNTATSAGVYANGSFIKANSASSLAQQVYDYANTLAGGIAQDSGARVLAQGAYDTANAAYIIGQGAYNAANTNASNITLINGVDTYQNGYIQLVESKATTTGYYANAAFEAANTAYNAGGVIAGSYANSAFGVANAASSYANSAYVTANNNTTAITVAGSYANAAFGTANTGIDIAQRAWNQANTSASFLYSVQSTPPSTPGPSDLWYDTSTDILFQYLTADGSNYFWIDIDSPTVTANSTTISYTYTGYGRAVASAIVFGGF